MTAPKDREALIEVIARDMHEDGCEHPWDRAAAWMRQPCIEAARRVLDAIEARGCAVVPVEPTQDMLWAARWRVAGPSDTAAVLRSAIAASPYRKESTS